jgi:TonB family protein
MNVRIKLFLAIYFASTVAFVPLCRAWENEIPSALKNVCIYAPEPDYPPAVYRRGISGKGIFRVTVDAKTGRVSEVKVVRTTGYQILNELAAKAFLQWRFKPGLGGSFQISYDFHVLGGVRELH